MSEYLSKFIATWLVEVALVLVPLALFFGVGFFIRDKIEKYLFIIIISIFVYVAIALILFFYIPTLIMVFKPDVAVEPVSKNVLFEKIGTAFHQKNEEGEDLFEITSQGDKIIVTWSNKINYRQLISMGVDSKKRVFTLKLNEKKHEVILSQEDVDWGWSLNANNFSFSGSYFKGLSMESEVVLKPSFEFTKEGSLSFDIKKIKYSSAEIMNPLLKILSSNGWTTRVSIF